MGARTILSPTQLLDALIGKPLSLLEAAYGGELVMGFGATRGAPRRLNELRAKWELSTQMSGWTIEAAEGVISTSRSRDYAKAIERARPEVVGHTVEEVSLRNGAFGLTIRLSGGASILVHPDRVDVRKEPGEPVWELFGPNGVYLRAVPSEGLLLADPNGPA